MFFNKFSPFLWTVGSDNMDKQIQIINKLFKFYMVARLSCKLLDLSYLITFDIIILSDEINIFAFKKWLLVIKINKAATLKTNCIMLSWPQ